MRRQGAHSHLPPSPTPTNQGGRLSPSAPRVRAPTTQEPRDCERPYTYRGDIELRDDVLDDVAGNVTEIRSLEAKAVDDALELFDALMTNDLLARAALAAWVACAVSSA